MDTAFRPTDPQRFGGVFATLSHGPLGGADLLGGAAPLTVNTTTDFQVANPRRRMRFLQGVVQIYTTLPVDADGTVLLRIMKYDVSAGAAVQVSEDQSLEVAALTLKTPARLLQKAGVTEAVLTADIGDFFFVRYANNSAAIDTQPGNVTVSIEVALLD